MASSGLLLSYVQAWIVPEGSCELCEAARFTEWYHEDEICWAAECEACRVPMVVWKQHSASPSEEVRTHLLAVLEGIAIAQRYERWAADEVMRTIPDHYHVHARPLPALPFTR